MIEQYPSFSRGASPQAQKVLIPRCQCTRKYFQQYNLAVLPVGMVDIIYKTKNDSQM